MNGYVKGAERRARIGWRPAATAAPAAGCHRDYHGDEGMRKQGERADFLNASAASRYQGGTKLHIEHTCAGILAMCTRLR